MSEAPRVISRAAPQWRAWSSERDDLGAAIDHERARALEVLSLRPLPLPLEPPADPAALRGDMPPPSPATRGEP
jgi:hypothetical protein